MILPVFWMSCQADQDAVGEGEMTQGPLRHAAREPREVPWLHASTSCHAAFPSANRALLHLRALLDELHVLSLPCPILPLPTSRLTLPIAVF